MKYVDQQLASQRVFCLDIETYDVQTENMILNGFPVNSREVLLHGERKTLHSLTLKVITVTFLAGRGSVLYSMNLDPEGSVIISTPQNYPESFSLNAIARIGESKDGLFLSMI